MTESTQDQTSSKEGKAIVIADDGMMMIAATSQHHEATKEDPFGYGEVVWEF